MNNFFKILTIVGLTVVTVITGYKIQKSNESVINVMGIVYPQNIKFTGHDKYESAANFNHPDTNITPTINKSGLPNMGNKIYYEGYQGISGTGGGTNSPSNSVDYASMREEVDDLRLAQIVQSCGSVGRESAFSYKTLYGCQSIYPTNTDDISSSTNATWEVGMWTVGSPTTNAYTPASSNAWGLVYPLPAPVLLSASVVYNDKIYSIGGKTNSAATSNIYTYTYGATNWVKFSPSLPVNLFAHSAIVYYGKIYVIGGTYGNLTEHLTNVYSYTAGDLDWVNEPGLPSARLHGSVAICFDKIYYMGGSCPAGEGGLSDKVFTYNFGEGDWKEAASLPYSMFTHATVEYNNLIYLVGGKTSVDETYLTNVYTYGDAITNMWTPLPLSIETVTTNGIGNTSLVVHSNKIFAIGGYNGVSPNAKLTNVYSYATGYATWSNEYPLYNPLYDSTAVSYSNKIYLIGGAGSNDTPTNAVYTYPRDRTITNTIVGSERSFIKSSTLTTPWDSTRASMFVWIESARKNSGTNLINANYLTDWSNSITFDGTNWYTFTNMIPIIDNYTTNGYYNIITKTNGYIGNNLQQSITCNSGVVVKVTGWGRFAGYGNFKNE